MLLQIKILKLCARTGSRTGTKHGSQVIVLTIQEVSKTYIKANLRPN